MRQRHLAIFMTVVAIAWASAYADSDDFTACFKKCMRTVNDKDKCEHICSHL